MREIRFLDFSWLIFFRFSSRPLAAKMKYYRWWNNIDADADDDDVLIAAGSRDDWWWWYVYDWDVPITWLMMCRFRFIDEASADIIFFFSI